jgi:hypothetical protein
MALPDSIRLAQEQSDGGIEVVAIGAGNAADLVAQAAEESRLTGFVPVLAGMGGPAALPPDLLHRHVLVVCDGVAGLDWTIGWVRALAQASPRRPNGDCWGRGSAAGRACALVRMRPSPRGSRAPTVGSGAAAHARPSVG